MCQYGQKDKPNKGHACGQGKDQSLVGSIVRQRPCNCQQVVYECSSAHS